MACMSWQDAHLLHQFSLEIILFVFGTNFSGDLITDFVVSALDCEDTH